MFKRPIVLIVAIVSIAATATVEAKPKHRVAPKGVIACDMRGCSDKPSAVRAHARHVAATETRDVARAQAYDVDVNGNAAIVGSRPEGCPYQFCGCEASLYVFGEKRPELFLASNWIRKFPRAAPASGMVAARNGHVMVLMSQIDGKDWLVHDGNSGGHRTREHVRSIGGYVIVDPRGSRTAAR